MSDAELIARLRDWPYQGETMAGEAADRIEALIAEREKDHANINLKADFIDKTINQLAEAEAKLAKAVEATVEEIAMRIGGMIRGGDGTEYEEGYNDALATAERYVRTTLAEIKGESHE